MTNRALKKALSLVLAVLMMISLLPTSAFAFTAGESVQQDTRSQTNDQTKALTPIAYVSELDVTNDDTFLNFANDMMQLSQEQVQKGFANKDAAAFQFDAYKNSAEQELVAAMYTEYNNNGSIDFTKYSD